MNAMLNFEKQAGGRWTGITFHQDTIPDGRLADRPMKLCEAIKASSRGPLILTRELMDCPGALRSFGWNTDGSGQLAEKMAAINSLDKKEAEKLIRDVPRLKDPLTAITVGDYESPHVMVSYAQPESAMRIIYEWQRLTSTNIDVILSSVMAVCGWVIAGTQINQAVSLSFGCPESRKACAIGNDRLIVGLPSELAKKLGS